VHKADKGYHFEWDLFFKAIFNFFATFLIIFFLKFWKRNELKNQKNLKFIFSVETSDGSKHQETGNFKYVGGLTVKGSYEFVDENGQVHKVSFSSFLIS
jgi:hypothetical protein